MAAAPPSVRAAVHRTERSCSPVLCESVLRATLLGWELFSLSLRTPPPPAAQICLKVLSDPKPAGDLHTTCHTRAGRACVCSGHLGLPRPPPHSHPRSLITPRSRGARSNSVSPATCLRLPPAPTDSGAGRGLSHPHHFLLLTLQVHTMARDGPDQASPGLKK